MESPGHLPIQWFHRAFKVFHYPFWSGLPVNTEGKTPSLTCLHSPYQSLGRRPVAYFGPS